MVRCRRTDRSTANGTLARARWSIDTSSPMTAGALRRRWEHRCRRAQARALRCRACRAIGAGVHTAPERHSAIAPPLEKTRSSVFPTPRHSQDGNSLHTRQINGRRLLPRATVNQNTESLRYSYEAAASTSKKVAGFGHERHHNPDKTVPIFPNVSSPSTGSLPAQHARVRDGLSTRAPKDSRPGSCMPQGESGRRRAAGDLRVNRDLVKRSSQRFYVREDSCMPRRADDDRCLCPRTRSKSGSRHVRISAC